MKRLWGLFDNTEDCVPCKKQKVNNIINKKRIKTSMEFLENNDVFTCCKKQKTNEYRGCEIEAYYDLNEISSPDHSLPFTASQVSGNDGIFLFQEEDPIQKPQPAVLNFCYSYSIPTSTTTHANICLCIKKQLVIENGKYITAQLDLKECIGRGEFSTVYKSSVDTKISNYDDESYAVKILRSDLSLYWKNEVKIMRYLSTKKDHSNFIVPLIAHGEDVIILKLLNSNLKNYIKSKKLDFDEIVKISLDIIESLIWIHKQGVIHRDLTTENIFIHENKILIGDFGISCMSEQIPDGFAEGKINYRALEGSKTFSSDVYSFGCCLLEMLTGKMPFEGEKDRDVFLRVSRGEREKVPKFEGKLSGVGEIVEKCLSNECERVGLEDVKIMFKKLIE